MSIRWSTAGAFGFGLIVLVWCAAGATVLAPGFGTGPRALSTAASGGVDWINVTVSDQLKFTLASAPLSSAEITPGDVVHVEVTQLGSAPHTFTLSPTAGFSFPSSDSSSDLQTYFNSHAPLVNLNVSATTGARASGTFTAPSVGQYEYVCLEAGHFAAGMFGFLGSGEAGAGAGAPPYDGPGAPVFIIAGVITGLVIIALVLGFVVGKRRGSSEEMPPERLGYPEPPKPRAPGGTP